jgi:hypothetical protein
MRWPAPGSRKSGQIRQGQGQEVWIQGGAPTDILAMTPEMIPDVTRLHLQAFNPASGEPTRVRW